jgi:hypothetical protein
VGLSLVCFALVSMGVWELGVKGRLCTVCLPVGASTGWAGGRNQPLTRTGSTRRAMPRRAYQNEVPKMYAWKGYEWKSQLHVGLSTDDDDGWP